MFSLLTFCRIILFLKSSVNLVCILIKCGLVILDWGIVRTVLIRITRLICKFSNIDLLIRRYEVSCLSSCISISIHILKTYVKFHKVVPVNQLISFVYFVRIMNSYIVLYKIFSVNFLHVSLHFKKISLWKFQTPSMFSFLSGQKQFILSFLLLK